MKSFLSALCLFCFVGLPMAYADIIPRDMKPIFVSAIIENGGEFPGYTLVEIETLGDEVRAGSVIGPDGRVSKGYKLNRLHILAVPKDAMHGEDAPDWRALMDDAAIPRYDGIIETGQKLVPRDSPLCGRITHYKITSIDNGAIRMEKTAVKELTVEPDVTIGQFNRAFMFTLCVEFVAMLLLIRFGYRSKPPGVVRIAFTVLLGQTATLPLLWYLMTQYALMGSVVFLVAEAVAVAVEGAIYKPLLRMTWAKAMFASLLCNALSVFMGQWV